MTYVEVTPVLVCDLDWHLTVRKIQRRSLELNPAQQSRLSAAPTPPKCTVSSSSSPPPVTSQALIVLFRPRLTVSSKPFQAAFYHPVYNSALFSPSCCCSFLLHVVANLIRIFSVSCRLVLLSAIPKFLHSFCGHKECARLFFCQI